jgi:hypothetical protein
MTHRVLNHRPSPAMVVAVAALLVAVGGVAFAAIPDSQGVIHACYQKTTGALRVVDSAGNCRRSETPIEWNQHGPPGQGNLRALGDIRLSNGESRDLVREGPLTLTAQCRLDFAPFPNEPDFKFDEAEVLVSTSEDHAAFGSASAGEYFNGIREQQFGNRDLLANAPEGDRVLAQVRARTDVAEPASYVSAQFSAAAPDGTHLSGVLDVSADALGSGGCVFGGHVVS